MRFSVTLRAWLDSDGRANLAIAKKIAGSPRKEWLQWPDNLERGQASTQGGR